MDCLWRSRASCLSVTGLPFGISLPFLSSSKFVHFSLIPFILITEPSQPITIPLLFVFLNIDSEKLPSHFQELLHPSPKTVPI